MPRFGPPQSQLSQGVQLASCPVKRLAFPWMSLCGEA